MSYNDSYWEGRGNCPECGKFCGQITGHAGYQGEGYTAGPYLEKVTGVCKEHGEVKLLGPYGWDDFFGDLDD